MDNIIEKCVTKPKDKKDRMIVILALTGSLILIAVPFLFSVIIAFSPVFILLGGFIIYKAVSSRNIEYEYELVENEMTIAMIINKRNRKKIFNATFTEFDIIAPRKSRFYEEHGKNVQATIEAVSSLEQENVYFGVIQYKTKKTCVFFETDEKMLRHIKKQADYKLKS